MERNDFPPMTEREKWIARTAIIIGVLLGMGVGICTTIIVFSVYLGW